MNRWLATILFLVVSALLTRVIPFSSFFRNLNTMLHEFGHALVTLLLSGRVTRIELNPDHSGVTYTLLTSWSVIPVALAGYVLASLFSLLLFYFYNQRREQLGMITITLIAAVMLMFFVHQGFGLWWLIGFIVLNAIVFLFGGAIQHFYYVLVLFLTLEESVLSTITIVFHSIVAPQAAGDAASLQQMTGVPAIVWSVGFVVVALYCAKVSLSLLFSRWKEGFRKRRNVSPL